jgi:hypothetical protein
VSHHEHVPEGDDHEFASDCRTGLLACLAVAARLAIPAILTIGWFHNLIKAAPAPLEDYSADGVDLTLIRWTLSLSPAERLRFLKERINEVLAIRERNAAT